MTETEQIIDQLEAEVRCLTCNKTRWVSYAFRHGGKKFPPSGVTEVPFARCRTCMTGRDYTEWNGRVQWKK